VRYTSYIISARRFAIRTIISEGFNLTNINAKFRANLKHMKSYSGLLIIIICSFFSLTTFSQQGKQPFYEVKVYHFDSKEQESTIDNYLENAFLPALNRKGIKNVGVFKPIGNDTLQDKRVYVLIPFKSAEQFTELPQQLEKDSKLNEAGKEYLETAYTKPAYKRVESILIKAFVNMPSMEVPALKNDLQKRVYELRSYEGATEKAHKIKVQQFNDGSEITLFKRLGFNAVFYGSVIAGSKMPNLMYMTTFEDMASRNQHWDTFKADEEWKKLAAVEYYKGTVSKSEIILLSPVSYSGL
jgi:hypothetical protein